MQINQARHLKTYEDFRKITNEDSRGLERHFKGRNFVFKSQDILYESKHPRRQKKHAFMHMTTHSWPSSMSHVP